MQELLLRIHVHGLDGTNGLEDLGLICNSAKWAVYKALSAGYALIIVNICFSIFIRRNSIHTAGCCTRSLLNDNGIVGTYSCTLTTLDTFIFINVGASL